jgi:hypothetical protein
MLSKPQPACNNCKITKKEHSFWYKLLFFYLPCAIIVHTILLEISK